MDKAITDTDAETIMANLLVEGAEAYGHDVTTWTFEERGLLTSNRGLVVKIDGQEFQLTIVKP